MTIAAQKITPCLWFDTEAEEAAKFYVSIFKDSKIRSVNRYGKGGQEESLAMALVDHRHVRVPRIEVSARDGKRSRWIRTWSPRRRPSDVHP